MRKLLVLILLVFSSVVAFSQPQPPANPQQGDFSTVRLHRNPQQAPLAPATLLLLGLGASAVGVKVYRNKKH